MIPPRHVLRRLAGAAGVPVRLGGPLPDGRRIEILVRDGAIVADQEVTARWRGRPLVVESPAPLAADVRAALHQAVAVFTPEIPGAVFEFVWEQESPVLVDVRETVEFQPGLTAWLTAGEPALGRAVDARCLDAHWPVAADGRVDGTVATGEHLTVPAGTLLATVRIPPAPRTAALATLDRLLGELRCAGIPNDLPLLRQILARPEFAQVPTSARWCDSLAYTPLVIEVLVPGIHTTVQDFPGRLGAWAVGVPPSGPMDDLAFRLANRLVGNPADAAGLELTLAGPTLRFHAPAVICLAGPESTATVDGGPLPRWRAVAVAAGAVVAIGGLARGCRATLAIRGGLAVPAYLGSRATFDLGGFGGHAGRPLKAGDLLPLAVAAPAAELAHCPPPLPAAAQPKYLKRWELGILAGPHRDPEFFTGADIQALESAIYTVHHNSNRTGIRLMGPKPAWARPDGGEAGLHPSNIHDNAYAVGSIDFTGDMPILLGPDGPSLGGFVCPGVVVEAERWKLGQLRPGDTLRFVRRSVAEATARREQQDRFLTDLAAPPALPTFSVTAGDGAVAFQRGVEGDRPALVIRRAGDRNLLVEYGPLVLDLDLRLRVHLLWQAFVARAVPGIIDLTPGIRSLQLHFDPRRISDTALIALVRECDAALPSGDVVVPNRTVHLPLSWDDPSTRKAIEIYTRSVNPTAPWCPSNLEFIRRINGLNSIEAVKRIVFAADYLVLGLGDVYLGAPVATPIDPRHRLVTTKYNPARTWTPENAVGIGGAYLCIYGMEGPGGYQFVGRTVPIWNSWTTSAAFQPGTPWLLRFFDVLKWYEVGAEELLDLRAQMRAGTWSPRITEGTFSQAAHRRYLAEHAAEIAAFRTSQRAAFQEERRRWAMP